MSVASQSLMDNVTYEDLYHRWEQGNWSAYDIDFSGDKAGWDGLSDIQRRSAMWIYSMFFYGEDRVADTLAPYITAAPTEEQSYFLATQQVDEVRHSVFFHRFFKEVIGVGGDSIQQTLSSTLPQLNWGYRGIFDRLDLMAEELRKDRSLPKYAQAITLYHLIVEGSLAQPGQHFIEDFFASEETMPGFSAGHGQRLPRRAAPHRLRRQGALRAAGRRGARLRGVQSRRGRAAARSPALRPGGLPPAEHGPLLHRVLRLLARGHLRLRPQTDPPALAHDRLPDRGDAARRLPLRPREEPGEEIAENQVKLMMGGILGPPDGVPQSSPELQRLYFDVIERVVNTKAANGSRLVYQWRFSDAEPWHLVIDNGSTHAEPGEAPNPNLVLEASWADFIATGKPDANPLKMVLTRRLRPRGSLRELARMRKVFPS